MCLHRLTVGSYNKECSNILTYKNECTSTKMYFNLDTISSITKYSTTIIIVLKIYQSKITSVLDQRIRYSLEYCELYIFAFYKNSSQALLYFLMPIFWISYVKYFDKKLCIKETNSFVC